MAFPTQTSAVTNGTSATSTPTVNLPADIAAGDLLVVLIRVAVAGAIGWPDGDWNEVFDGSPDAADDQMALAWKKAHGDEGSSIQLSCTSGKFAALALLVKGAADPTVQPPEFSTVATGSGTTPNPTTCTPTGGAKDYLWVWLGGWADESSSPPTGDPANYSGRIGASSGTSGLGTTNCRVAMSFRENNASSEDPGSWTISISAAWTAYCMALHPAPPAPAEEHYAESGLAGGVGAVARRAAAGLAATSMLAASLAMAVANAPQDDPYFAPTEVYVEETEWVPTVWPLLPHFQRSPGPRLSGWAPEPAAAEEEPWQPPAPWPTRWGPVRPFQAQDEVGFTPVEEYWLVHRAWPVQAPAQPLQADDDFSAPPLNVEETEWSPTVWPRLPHFQRPSGPRLSGWETEAPPPFAPDEEPWTPPAAWNVPWRGGLIAAQDELPNGRDEDYWLQLAVWYAPWQARLFQADDEWIQPRIEETGWMPPAPWPVAASLWFPGADDDYTPQIGSPLPDDAWLPTAWPLLPHFQRPAGPRTSGWAAEPFGGSEEPWVHPVTWKFVEWRANLLGSDDEWAPAGFAPDEDYWLQPPVHPQLPHFQRPAGPRLSGWAAEAPPPQFEGGPPDDFDPLAMQRAAWGWPEPGVIIQITDSQAALSMRPEEDYWYHPITWPVEWRAWTPPADELKVAGPATVQGHEDYWRNEVALRQWPWGNNPLAIHPPWEFEERVPVPTTLQFDEEPWNPPPPWPHALWQPLPVGDRDEIPAGNLISPLAAEDYWQSGVLPAWPWQNSGAISPPWEPEELPPPPPLPVDELYPVFQATPPWPKPGLPTMIAVRFNWFFDWNDPPAGSLVPTPIGRSRFHHVRRNATGSEPTPQDATQGAHRHHDAEDGEPVDIDADE